MLENFIDEKIKKSTLNIYNFGNSPCVFYHLADLYHVYLKLNIILST